MTHDPTYKPTEADADVIALHENTTKPGWEAYQRISKRSYELRARYFRALQKIRNSGGSPVVVLSSEGHSFCIHEANAALAQSQTEERK